MPSPLQIRSDGDTPKPRHMVPHVDTNHADWFAATEQNQWVVSGLTFVGMVLVIDPGRAAIFK